MTLFLYMSFHYLTLPLSSFFLHLSLSFLYLYLFVLFQFVSNFKFVSSFYIVHLCKYSYCAFMRLSLFGDLNFVLFPISNLFQHSFYIVHLCVCLYCAFIRLFIILCIYECVFIWRLRVTDWLRKERKSLCSLLLLNYKIINICF